MTITLLAQDHVGKVVGNSTQCNMARGNGVVGSTAQVRLLFMTQIMLVSDVHVS